MVVLGDDSLLKKCLNPHLITVLSESEGDYGSLNATVSSLPVCVCVCV